MKPIEKYNIPHLQSSLRNVRTELDGYIRKARIWKHFFWFSLAAIIILGLLGLAANRFVSECPWIAWLMAGGMFACFGTAVLADIRWQSCIDRANLLCYFARPLEISLAEARDLKYDGVQEVK